MPQSAVIDPREMYPAPPFEDQHQPPPGDDTLMDPRPDYGEAAYEASYITGMVYGITGGTPID